MKLFILVTLISAAVGQLAQGNRFPGFLTDATDDNVITKCTYWKGVESSVCHTYRFKVDNRNMEEFRPNMYGMMNGYDRLFGNAQMKAQACYDAPEKDRYWKACPSMYIDGLMEFSDGMNEWKTLSGCAVNETLCKESCNHCGEENYITAEKEVEKQTNLRCLKIMDHFPFSCMEKKVVETPLPSIFVIFLNEAVLEDALQPNDGNNIMCVTFNFRRRASADCPLDELSRIFVATEKSKTYALYDGSTNANFDSLDPMFTEGTNEKRAEMNDQNYCMFNVWRKALFTFHNANEDGDSANNDVLGTELQIVVYRNVDHIDIDAVEIYPGDCDNQIDDLEGGVLDFPSTTPAAGDGVFLGIKNIE